MDTTAGTPSLTVMDDITARLAAITPEQIVTPKGKPERNAHYVSRASERTQRLFTLYSMLATQTNELIREGLRISRKQPLSDADEARENQLRVEVAMLKEFTKLVERMFWLDVRRQEPELAGKPNIGIYEDWKLCWQEKNEEDAVASMGIHVIGIGGDAHNGLMEMLLGLGDYAHFSRR